MYSTFINYVIKKIKEEILYILHFKYSSEYLKFTNWIMIFLKYILFNDFPCFSLLLKFTIFT